VKRLALGRSEALLAERLEAVAVDDLPDGVVVDLAGAKTVGSLLLTSLRDSAERTRARGGALVVVCCNPSLAGFLRLMLLGRAFAVVGDHEDVRLR